MKAADVMRDAWARYHLLRPERFSNKAFDVQLAALRAAAGGERCVLVWDDTGEVTVHGLELDGWRHHGDGPVYAQWPDNKQRDPSDIAVFRLVDVVPVGSPEEGQ